MYVRNWYSHIMVCRNVLSFTLNGSFYLHLPSSVMVPLLEPPLLLEHGWEEAEDNSPITGLGVGDGDGVKVGDVLLDVEELPDCGLFFRSTFCGDWKLVLDWWKFTILIRHTGLVQLIFSSFQQKYKLTTFVRHFLQFLLKIQELHFFAIQFGFKIKKRIGGNRPGFYLSVPDIYI